MSNEAAIIDEIRLEEKIYFVCNQKVMLNFELEEIYGYETKNFNWQVKNNIEKFDVDFMFQLTNEELEQLSRCKNFTLISPQVGAVRDIFYMYLRNKVFILSDKNSA